MRFDSAVVATDSSAVTSPARRTPAGIARVRTTIRRLRGGGLLLLGCLCCSGCVYLRLLEFKRQLADFDAHFIVDTHDGLTLRFRHPVLRDDDMGTLGIAPAARQKLGAGERWRFRWVKDPVAADGAAVRYEQTVDFVFVNGELTTVLVPERFFVFFPKPVFLAGLKAMGQATVDRQRRRATAVLEHASRREPLPVVRQADLLALLGAPVEVKGDAATIEWRYVFKADSTEQKAGPIEMTFTLDAATGTVQRIRGRLVTGTIELDYAEEARANATPGT